MSTLAPLAVDGPAAPPRANGELVFAEPWESRAFGMAVTLHDSGAFTWPTFQAALIARIAAWESGHPEGECWSYYQQWLGALEDVLAELVGPATTTATTSPATATVTATDPSDTHRTHPRVPAHTAGRVCGHPRVCAVTRQAAVARRRSFA